MSASKERMLNTIRQALRDVPEYEQPISLPVNRNYRTDSNSTLEERVKLFAERVNEYKATVTIINRDQIPAAIEEACRRNHVNKLVVPPETSTTWLPSQIELLQDNDIRLTNKELDNSDGVITGCTVAIAQTGTIVLSGGTAQGRRVLTLLPDYHLCLVQADQIVETVNEAFTLLTTTSPLTFISGPSATSDIELNRVEGVHGPRKLDVLVVME